jgi:CRP/FNR family cyclic AMP-dependent transcriptional regulator
MLDPSLLLKVPLFANLERDDLKSILDLAKIRKVDRGALIFQQGEKGDSLFLVLEGRVKAVLLGQDGREVILAYLEPGELVGEMALFDPEEERSATVFAATDCTLLSLSGRHFMSFLSKKPSVAITLLRSLTRRLKETSARIGNLIFLDTYSRVGGYLVAIAKKQGRPLADGSILVTRPSQQEIAQFIGASRETVSRALKELEHQGLIKMVGKKVILYRLQR